MFTASSCSSSNKRPRCDAEVQSQKVYAVKKQHNKEKGEDNFVDEQTDAEENTGDTNVQGNDHADEPWYYNYGACMKLWKEKQERKDGRKRRVKAAGRKSERSEK
nr:hypothetical protein [Tanacetum cinerariifolium]